ncbi:SDR family NAD(P)-dependent oxidoreductase [Oceanibium sediminis]|uniref:SDR family NAD(P)-dependent oxidoreductase n=1 Tax=Oceanibium sediminis TaxID=2026339 RepID=UPI000DD4346F|nr:SDR family NAD(P)-dependent oxidoreductase [Oceanibium sediminis]
MSETWIILGASSAMARALARSLAADGHELLLCGRDADDLARDAADLRLRGAALAEVMAFDTRDPDSFAPIIARAEAAGGVVNVAVFAGSMPPQEAVESDPALLDGVVTDNFAAAARFLLHIAPLMESRGAGSVVGVGSVAGDRGRIGNYVYGAAKAGFHTFLSGHRNRMARKGVHVMTVKPGFVDTAMTWGLEGMFLVASPSDVARDIRKGLRKKRNVIYTPIFWTLIMLIIRMIPERIFKKLQI